jgi:hypothetical protein
MNALGLESFVPGFIGISGSAVEEGLHGAPKLPLEFGGRPQALHAHPQMGASVPVTYEEEGSNPAIGSKLSKRGRNCIDDQGVLVSTVKDVKRKPRSGHDWGAP